MGVPPSVLKRLSQLGLILSYDIYPPDGKEKVLNERQLKILQHMDVNSEKFTTVVFYQKINNVSQATALKDIEDLLADHYLVGEKEGRLTKYYATYKSTSFLKNLHD